MAELVMVHGIAQEQKSADVLEAEWLPALAGGIRTAGHPALADRIWRRNNETRLDTRMAFYGDLFLTPGRQGFGDPLLAADMILAEAVAMEWLHRAAYRSTDTRDRQHATDDLATMQLATGGGEPQGLRSLARPAINALCRLRWLAPLGIGFASRFVFQALGQVVTYFSDDALRQQTIDRVTAQIDENTKAVIAHSLGSVVAYEALHQCEYAVPLLATMGSPLGARTIILDRLRPAPAVPSGLARWINLVDRDDLVAAEPQLRSLFTDPGQVLESSYLVDNGARPHEARFYLAKAEVGSAVAAALARADDATP